MVTRYSFVGDLTRAIESISSSQCASALHREHGLTTMPPGWRKYLRGALFCAIALATTSPASAQVLDPIFFNAFEPITIKLAQPDIDAAFASAAVWNPIKARCDNNLNSVITDIYAGQNWHDAAQDYGICYNVALLKGDAKAPLYSKKAIAILKVLSRDYPVIETPNQNHQFLAFGDGVTKTFTLPMPILATTALQVFTNTAVAKPHSYTTTPIPDITPEFDSDALFPVLRIADNELAAKSNGPLQYTPEIDFHVSMRDDTLNTGKTDFNVLHWIGSKHPASDYFVTTNENASNTSLPASNFTASGTSLVFKTAPASGQTIFVKYVGSDYTQTGNGVGGVESVKPDGPGYNMRFMNVGLAYGFDAMRLSPDLTTALRQEFYGVMNQQLDWFTADGYEGLERGENPIGNYYIRGYLTGAMFTAYATDSNNSRAMPKGDLKPLARNLLMQSFNKIQSSLPGGYGPQGTYSEGTNQDMLQLFDLWKRLTTLDGAPEDLAPLLEWDANLVRATIHGMKPDRATFYDGGDWNSLPATPLIDSMLAFIKYQPNHAMAPFARQFLADAGSPVTGTKTDYKAGPGMFPLSYLAKTSGPVYARSDWSTSAVWLSMAAGPIIEDHQHLDQGHFTLQRGADYLLINSGGYNLLSTLPYHNTLGFNDVGFGDNIVYPPGQGDWGDKAKIAKYTDQDTFVYAQADIADAYINNDGVSKSVTRALRTLVYLRPNIVVVHDNMQVTNPGIEKIFNLNFNAPALDQNVDIFSAAHGSSKIFMRALVPANPVPTLAYPDYNDGAQTITNYQVSTVGQTTGTFLHLFQLTDSAQTTMATSSYLQSTDGREQGTQVDLGARRWIVMAATGATPLQNTTALTYNISQACPCTHVVVDLKASTNYQVTVLGGAGGTITAASDVNGVLTFSTDAPGTTGVQIH